MGKRRRHTPDQIIRKLAEGTKLLAGGMELDGVCRHLEIAESTWHRWVAQYGGMKASDAKRLKELEVENALADQHDEWADARRYFSEASMAKLTTRENDTAVTAELEPAG